MTTTAQPCCAFHALYRRSKAPCYAPVAASK